MNCPFDAGFKAGAKLGIAVCLFPVHAALGEDKFGDCAHPCFANAELTNTRLLVERDKLPLAHGAIRRPGW